MHLKWPGFNQQGTVIIQLAPEIFFPVNNSIDVDGETYTAKQELHVTVIGTQLGLILQHKLKQDRSIHQLLAKTFEDIDWSFEQSGPVHILVRKKKEAVEKSIVMLIEMHGLAEFYQQLKNLGLIAAASPVPPAHVTLYTRNCFRGIGVSSSELLKSLTAKTLPLSAFKKLCRV